MVKYCRLSITGSLDNRNCYQDITNFCCYIIKKTKDFKQKLAEAETIYDWDYPPEVVIFDITSGGGSTEGLAVAGKSILALSEAGIKTLGFAGSKATSAGYTLLACCDVIVTLAGAELGSIAVASCYVDESKELEIEGKRALFYSTHKDKFSGLLGENKSDKEILQILKDSADNSFNIIQDLILIKRPELKTEIAELNGKTIFVNPEQKTALYDLTANSLQELVLFLENNEITDMKFNKLFKGRAASTLLAQAATVSANYGGITSEIKEGNSVGGVQVYAQDSSAGNSVASLLAQSSNAQVENTTEKDTITISKADLAALIASMQVAQQTQSSATSAAIQEPAKTQVNVVTELTTFAQANGIEAKHVLTVLGLSAPLETQKTILLTLGQAADTSLQQQSNPNPLIGLAAMLQTAPADPKTAEETAYLAKLKEATDFMLNNG